MGTQDPYSSFHYLVHLSLHSGPSNLLAEFREAGGLATRPVPRTTVSDITLKRGVVNSSSLWDWITQARSTGAALRSNATITLRDETGRAVQSWKLINARPVKYTGPTLSGKGNDVAIEELVLSSESIEIWPP